MMTPELSSDAQSYFLSEAESQEIFKRDIIPSELGNFESCQSENSNEDKKPTRPLAVLIVGQTGAGKTRTAPPIKQAMRTSRGSEPAHFIADVYKTYHPAYQRLAAEKPNLASQATGPDARRWLSMASAYAAEKRMDVLLESACRHPADFVELARMFRDADYRVEVAILAVPEGLSRLGILTRFYEAESEVGLRSRGVLPSRLTPKRVHDESYEGLVAAANFVDEEEGVVDQVVVVRRRGAVVYANERVVGASKQGWANKGMGSVVDSIVKERASKLPRDEGEMAKADILKLKQINNAGLATELAEIETLLWPLREEERDGDNDEDASLIQPKALQLPTCVANSNSKHSLEVHLRLGLGLS